MFREMLDFKAIEEAREKLAEEKSEYKIVVHPSVVSYDYRIAWTWDEMDKRNKNNKEKDKLRLAFWMPARAYWDEPTRTSHYGKQRMLKFNERW